MIILTSKVKNQECEGNVGVFDMPTLGLETGGLKTPSSVSSQPYFLCLSLFNGQTPNLPTYS